MSDGGSKGELHLRVNGRTTDWKLLLVDEPPSEDELVSWMQEGMVARIRVTEQGTNEPHTLLVNFALVVAARILPATRGDRGVTF